MRFRSQQLATPAFKCPRDLVAWMGAVQAQDYDMSKWAVGMRIEGGTLRMVNEALEKGEIVRTHIMRPTWHWVAGEDIRWMLKLSGARIKKCVD
ncbi:DNA glycosylase AlkZ-like family protein, partial [Culturomica massiliensis]